MEVEEETRYNLTAMALLAALEVAAVGCLIVAWLDPTDAPDNTSSLWRTTVVVVASVLLTALGVGSGRLWRKHRDSRMRFLVLTTPAVLVLAVSGVMALDREPEVASAARWAWWCACLALAVLALAAWVANVLPDERPPEQRPRELPQRRIAAGVAVAVLGVVAVGVVATNGGPITGDGIDIQTAAAIDAPPTPPINGQIAYRVDFERGDADKLVPSGAGFARWVAGGDYTKGDLLEGFDGATGERRWSFREDSLNFLGVGATGVGRDSVVVVQSFDELLGLDATTGELLWRSEEGRLFDRDNPNRAVSPHVVMTTQRVPEPPGPTAAGYGTKWEALSPRTGEVMWSRTFRYQCWASAKAAADALLVHSCEDPPEVVAQVLDPATGQRRGVVTLSDLGVDPADLGRREGNVSIDEVKGGTALITVFRYQPGRRETKLVVDIATGKIVARPPENHGARYLGVDTLLTWPYGDRDDLDPLSTLTVGTNRMQSLSSWWDGGGDGKTFDLFARSGTDWLTFVPADQAAVRAMEDRGHTDVPRLRIIDSSGASRTVSDVCPDMRGVPGLVEVPGAVVAQCEGQWVGLR
ncbi:PQQ-binding-like beta-propeller repeat protein [Mycolicibacterium sediminis]|nr:PQQ-binding-like beta-propeller repeat protein [Mycolicibacterium sediminis]